MGTRMKCESKRPCRRAQARQTCDDGNWSKWLPDCRMGDSGGAGNQTSCLASTSLRSTRQIWEKRMSICSSQKNAWRSDHISFVSRTPACPRIFLPTSNHHTRLLQYVVSLLIASFPRMRSCRWLLRYVSMFGCRSGVEWLSTREHNPESCRVALVSIFTRLLVPEPTRASQSLRSLKRAFVRLLMGFLITYNKAQSSDSRMEHPLCLINMGLCTMYSIEI